MVNTKPVQSGKTTRQSFSKINEVIDMPNLIGIQRDSYNWFLSDGIKEVFKDVSPIIDSNGKFELSFVNTASRKTPSTLLKSARSATQHTPHP